MFAPPPKFSRGDKFGHKPTISLHLPVRSVPLSEGVKREKERERERTQNSECFIVEGHLTHYKWYDYMHAHTTYTKQLTNNTKQTDKTKRNRKKKQTQTKMNVGSLTE